MNSSKLLSSLVNDLLDLFRLKNGNFSVNSTKHNFREAMDEVIQMFAIQASQKGLQLMFDCHSNIPEELSFDFQRVKQVLINLISNSLKFTMAGSIVISAKII